MSLLVLILLAQFGSPAGQYPSQQRLPNPGIPLPGRKKTSNPSKDALLTQMVGFVRAVTDKTLEVAVSDSRTIEFQLTAKTEIAKDLKPGDYVEVEASANDQGVYTAATVKKTNPPKGAQNPVPPAATRNEVGKPAEETPAPPEPPTTIEKPAVKYDTGEEPPKLRRGLPPKRDRRIEPEADVTTASVAPPTEIRTFDKDVEVKVERPGAAAADPNMELLERARRESETFLNGLPNYVCQQFTTRFAGEGKPVKWQALDVVSAELVYEDGKESYRKLQINGKAVKGKVEETGSWSTGEFGTVLRDLFSPATRAKFWFGGYESIARQTAGRFPFTVDREGSHWKIGVPGQYHFPAYKGTVWIEKDSARVLRIEMQAVQIPKEFPMDTTELALDYDWITLGGTQKYLLPVKSEVLSCQRGTSDCMRNQIEFRNYHKYGATSDVIFK